MRDWHAKVTELTKLGHRRRVSPAGRWAGILRFMGDVVGLRAELQDALDRAESWLAERSHLGSDGDIGQLPGTDDDLWTLRRLRTRASSELIRVALLGGYSSGKS